jgi:hypothetical protein
MKTNFIKYALIAILANLHICTLIIAQSPNSFKYQAILRDGNGNIKASASANVRIDILQGSTTGTNVFAETFSAQTNAFGLINLEIGKGTLISGNISNIDWSNGLYFIKISIDGVEMGISQLLSVPYAKYADKAGETDPLFKISVANNIKSSDTARWSAKSNFNGDYNSLANKPTILNNDLNNTATGYSALKTNSGYYNAAYGYEALKSNLTGQSNVAIGDRALNLNTSGNLNTAVGSEALQMDTSGYSNTAIGATALISNTSGMDNTATGSEALFSNTTGNNNTAVGEDALLHNSTGFSNVAIGVKALYKNTVRGNLVAIGDSALYNENATALGALGSQGNYNTAIGSKVLYSNTTGYSNTALGFNTMVNNTGGCYNTAIGFGTLNNISTGNYNTAIGPNAGPSDGTLSNTGAFGYLAAPSASNTMVFGNSNVTGWGFGTAPGGVAIKVGSNNTNGNGAALTLAGVWTNASDSTKKYNIQPINYGLKEVLKLRPVSYQMKGSGYQDIGFIAQDVKLILPELVYGKEGEMTLSYGQITAVLTKAMQEQQKEIDLLKQQNKELLQMINELKKK